MTSEHSARHRLSMSASATLAFTALVYATVGDGGVAAASDGGAETVTTPATVDSH